MSAQIFLKLKWGAGLLLFLPLFLDAQTLIWSETFPDADGVINDPAGDWSSTCTSCSFLNTDDHFEVRNGEFVGRDMKGTGFWFSEWVDISAYENVSISVQVRDLADPDANDIIEVYYTTDGGSTYLLFDNGSNTDDIAGYNVATAQDINADSVRVVVGMITTFDDDIYAIDNIMIVAPEPQPGSGYALDFDDAAGSTAGDVVELSDNFPNLAGGDFTITAWVNSDNVGDAGQRIFCDDATNALDGFALSLGDPGTGSLRFYLRSVAPVSLDVPLVSPYLLTSNNWYHIAFTHNATTNARQIFINGLLAASDTYIGNPGANPDGRACIGGEAASSPENTNRFNGEIDEVSIWNTVRTSTQIRQQMCQKLNGNEAGLLAYYRFDDGAGQTVRDETGNYPGGMVNMDYATDWVVSAASLGDTSIFGYNPGAWLGIALVMQSNEGDSLIVSDVLGNPELLHVYNVQEPPNSLIGASGVGGNGQYYGVFHAYGTLTTYTATYHYGENNAYQGGVLDELFMTLYYRDDNADPTWATSVTGVNILSKTLTALAINTEFILGNSFAPLPITLLSFDAKPHNDRALIEWTTTSEINNDFFTVERSVDGQNFEPIIYRKGAGNSNQLIKYAAYDQSPVQGTAYYRLRQTDFNGAFSFSEVSAITMHLASEKVLVYPNPGEDIIYIDHKGYSVVNFNIFDLAGGEKNCKVSRLQSDLSRLNVQHLETGIYILRINTGFEQINKKLVINR